VHIVDVEVAQRRFSRWQRLPCTARVFLGVASPYFQLLAIWPMPQIGGPRAYSSLGMRVAQGWWHQAPRTTLSQTSHEWAKRERIESASRPLMYFDVLNDNLIKWLISYLKWISMFLMEVQMYSLIHLLEYNYEANGTLWSTMYNQSTNSSIVKNLCQVKQEMHMNKNKLNINLVQHWWLDLYKGRIDQVLSLSNGYPWE
jgi:hypothetical protein